MTTNILYSTVKRSIVQMLQGVFKFIAEALATFASDSRLKQTPE